MAMALLKFDLSNVDDRQEYERMNASLKMASFIFQLLYNSKKEVIQKYGENPDVYDVWQFIHEMANDYDINIDKLIL